MDFGRKVPGRRPGLQRIGLQLAGGEVFEGEEEMAIAAMEKRPLASVRA